MHSFIHTWVKYVLVVKSENIKAAVSLMERLVMAGSGGGGRSVEAQTTSSCYYCELQSVIKMENLQ